MEIIVLPEAKLKRGWNRSSSHFLAFRIRAGPSSTLDEGFLHRKNHPPVVKPIFGIPMEWSQFQ